jgi:hypothetical protein
MKKIIFVFGAVCLMGLASCGNRSNVTPSTNDTAVVDTDSVVGDSLVADSL